MSKPLVSVILGVYNQEQYVKQAIDSVLNQTYNNIELIITNNGSTDNSKGLIGKYSNIDSVSAIHYEHNISLSKVANNAISQATGKYICFLAGDDYYLPDYIDVNVKEISVLSEEYGIVYSQHYVYNSKSKKTFIDEVSFSKSGYVFDELMKSQVTGFISPFTPFIKKEVFDLVRYDETTFCEGESIFIRIAEHFKFKYINNPQLVMRDHENNQGKNYKDNFKLFYEHRLNLLSRYPNKKRLINYAISGIALRNAWIATRLMDDKSWVKECLSVAVKHKFTTIFNIKLILIVLFYPFDRVTISNMLFFLKNKTGRTESYIEEDYSSNAEK